MKLRIVLSVVVLCLITALPASATLIVATLPEYNGLGDPDIGVVRTVGDFLFVIPAGEQILNARFDSTFGNSQVANTAVMSVSVDGVVVGVCPDQVSPCWNAQVPTPFSFVFAPSQFALFSDGIATLDVLQTDCCVIRLGESTLTLETGPAAVPEPSTVLLFGSGAVALLRRRTRRR